MTPTNAIEALARTKLGLGLVVALVVRSIIGKMTLQALTGHDFAAGSMCPKVEATRDFMLASGQRAVGSLEQI